MSAPKDGLSASVDDSALLRFLMDQLPDAIYFKDLESRFIRINKALAAWYGLADPSEAVGKSDFDYYPNAFAQSAFEAEQAILKSGTPVLEREEKFVGRDGKSRWVSATKMLLKDKTGAVIGTFGLSRDLKQEKRAELKARDSEALYQSLIECLPQCIFRKDLEGRFVYVNQQLCLSMNKKPADLLGKTDYDVIPKPLANKYRNDDQWVVRNMKTLEVREEYKPKGKRKAVVVHVTKTPVYDSQGRVIGVQGVFWPESGKLGKQ